MRIYNLQNVARAGKTTTVTAHSLARRCYDEGILGSSLFFDRENPERSCLLFLTIAQDLAAKGPTGRIHVYISDAVKSERDLTSDELSRQFATHSKIVLTSSSQIRPNIVTDALNGSFSEDEELELLFHIFQEDSDVPLFPPSVRIFVTSSDI